MLTDREALWTLRLASRADASAISEVLTAAGIAAWGVFLGAQRIEAATRGKEHPADLVAVDAEGVFAFVAWDAASGEILRLYTHPRGWGRGAGRALLDRALDALRAAGHTVAWLHTEERNQRARRFYELHGWREEGPARVRDWQGTRVREPRYVGSCELENRPGGVQPATSLPLWTSNSSATRPDLLHPVHRHDVGRTRAPDRTGLDDRRYRNEARVGVPPASSARPSPSVSTGAVKAKRQHVRRGLPAPALDRGPGPLGLRRVDAGGLIV